MVTVSLLSPTGAARYGRRDMVTAWHMVTVSGLGCFYSRWSSGLVVWCRLCVCVCRMRIHCLPMRGIVKKKAQTFFVLQQLNHSGMPSSTRITVIFFCRVSICKYKKKTRERKHQFTPIDSPQHHPSTIHSDWLISGSRVAGSYKEVTLLAKCSWKG